MKRVLVAIAALCLIMAGCSTVSQPTTPANQADTPAGAISAYFKALDNKDYEGAYKLLHSKAQNPNPVTQQGTVHDAFLSQKPAGGLDKVEQAVAMPDANGYKFYDCQCYINPAVEAKIKLKDGTEKTIHLGKESDGNWHLLWSAKDGLQ